MSCGLPEVTFAGAHSGYTFQGGKFRFKQSDDSYADFSGALAVDLLVREWSPSGALVLTLTLGSGLSLEDDGETLVMDPLDIELPPGTYFHRLSVTWSDGDKQPIWAGTWTICEGD